MKKAFRHTPPAAAAPKTRKKRVAKPLVTEKQLKLAKLTAPIFNTRYQGMPYTYIRPLDPVWPSEPES